MANYILFGGAGSFGTRMTEYILNNTKDNIIIFSRGEKQQWEHKLKFSNNPRIKYIIGDIRDREAVDLAMENIDYVFLAAAMKHIGKCEEKLVFLSTDKAVNPTTIYGCSKLFIEMYIKAVDNKKTQLIRTRYGNVFGSTGSVVPIFDELVKEGKPLTVRNGEMTRFFMPVDKCVSIVMDALQNGQNGELWVYESKSCTIKELADAFSDNQIITGTESIEKNDEALVTISELNHSKKYKDYFIIRKDYQSEEPYNTPLTSYTANRLTQEEIKKMIEDWRKNYDKS